VQVIFALGTGVGEGETIQALWVTEKGSPKSHRAKEPSEGQEWWYTPVIQALGRLSRRIGGSRTTWTTSGDSASKKKKKKRVQT
jgi:hypothetical protein